MSKTRITSNNNRTGYTLIEVMVVVMLLAMLSVLLLPVMQSTKDTAKLAVCTMNLKQIYSGVITQSIGDGEGMFPPDPYKWEIYAEALVESDVMICPMEGDNSVKAGEGYEFLPEPIPDLRQGSGPESDETIFVFREKAAFELPKDLDVIYKVGRYSRDHFGGGTCNYDLQGELEAGTVVDVYYFSYDPVTNVNTGNEGEITFGDNALVLGLIGKTGHLNRTDELLGARDHEGNALSVFPDTLGCRGVEGCNSGQYADSIEITERRRSIIHQFSHASDRCKDDFRIITTPGAGSSYAMNVEVPQNPSNDFQLLLSDSRVPWINFKNGVDTHDYTFEQSIDARHFGKVNTLSVQGSVELMEVENIRPESPFWRS